MLVVDLKFVFKISRRFQNAGMSIREYNSAVWFRENSTPSDMIVADYYRSQVFAGVCGGRALFGAYYPLRTANVPFISDQSVVKDDIYTIYATSDPEKAASLMRAYGCNYVYVSLGLIYKGGFASTYRKGFGVDANLEKFEDKRYFTKVYTEPISKIRIFKLRKP